MRRSIIWSPSCIGGSVAGRIMPDWPNGGSARLATSICILGTACIRADRSTFSGSGRFSAEEVPNQIDFNRDYWGAIWGSVFFRAENITRYSSGNFVEQVSERPVPLPGTHAADAVEGSDHAGGSDSPGRVLGRRSGHIDLGS